MTKNSIATLKAIALQIFSASSVVNTNPVFASIVDESVEKGIELVLNSTKEEEVNTVGLPAIVDKETFWANFQAVLSTGLDNAVELVKNNASYVGRREVRALLNAAGKARDRNTLDFLFRNYSSHLAS